MGELGNSNSSNSKNNSTYRSIVTTKSTESCGKRSKCTFQDQFPALSNDTLNSRPPKYIMNAYLLSLLPIDRNDVSMTIVCDNAVSSHPCCTNTTSSEWVHVEQSLQLPALRRMKKRTTSGCTNNNKKDNSDKNTNNKSRHFIRDSYSEQDVLEALQECMNIVNNGKREFVSIPTKQHQPNTGERLDRRNYYQRIEKNNKLLTFDVRNTAPKQMKLPPLSIRSTSSSSIKVVIPHIQYQKKDNLTKKSSIIPPKIPRRRSSLLILVNPSSSSLLNMNSIKHVTPSEQRNASW